MKSDHSTWRKVSYILMPIGAALFLILSNGFLVSALAAAQPPRSTEVNYAGVAAKSAANQSATQAVTKLKATTSLTLYFPLIFHDFKFDGKPLTPTPPPVTEPTPPPVTEPTPTPIACNPTKGTGGLEPGIYERTVGDLRATIVVSKKYDPNKPTYFAFYLHGDDGNYKKFQNPENPVTQFVENQGWIFIAPQSSHPDIHWYINANRQVKELDQVFQIMFANYNLCRNIIIGASMSGGSTFISGHFFPDLGQKYPMHVNLVCLGWTDEDARRKIRKLGRKPEVVARSSFRFTYGDKDRFLPYIISTIEVYTKSGFDVTVEEVPGAYHCMPDRDKKIRNNWRNLVESLDLN